MGKKKSTSKQRIAEMMTLLNIKQVDIVKRTGIPKSTLSHYLSGKRTPTQEQLSVISDPYGINPTWLMGYDVPMWLKDIPKSFDSPEDFENAWEEAGGGPHPEFKIPWTGHGPQYKIIATKEENDLINAYRAADDVDRRAVKRILGVETKKDTDVLDA